MTPDEEIDSGCAVASVVICLIIVLILSVT